MSAPGSLRYIRPRITSKTGRGGHELAACQVSSETLAGQKRSRLLADIFKQTALVTIAALESASIIPAAAEIHSRRVLIRMAAFVHGVRRYCPARPGG